MMNIKTLLLDRDGTLNKDVGGSPTSAQIELLPGVIEGLKRFQSMGMTLYIVTNHASIGRGDDTVENHEACMQRLLSLLKEEGITIADYRTCPHSPDEQCSCRKPEIGMFKLLEESYAIDPQTTLMVGDKDADIVFGKRIGACTARINSGMYPYTEEADYTVQSIEELSTLLL